MKKIAAILAEGFEEGEALFTVDIFRRAGFSCDLIGLNGGYVTGCHGITAKADKVLGDNNLEDYDMLFIPGGLPGATNVRDDARIINIVKAFDADPDKYLAAICAAPIVFAKADIVAGRKATSNPGEAIVAAMEEAGADYADEIVAVDGHMITSRGPATLLPFAFTIIDMLGGDSASVGNGMLYPMLCEYIKNN